MREDDLLKLLSKFWKTDKKLLVPNGDDALAIDVEGEKAILVTVDTGLENVHFTTELLTFAEIGYRAVAGALSDIAAMGGIPVTILIDLEIPESDPVKIESIYEGIKVLQDQFNFSVGGGNIVHGERWRLTTTVIGSVEKDYILKRNGFREGDRIYITGDLGRVNFFFQELGRPERDPNVFDSLRNKFARPVPRINEIQHLKRLYRIDGAIDISDGLGIDLTRVAKASDVDIVINLESLPYCDELNALKTNELEFYIYIVSSGEEYEVCFCSPEEIKSNGVSEIGFVKNGHGKVFGILKNQIIDITNLGYDHLTTSILEG